MASYSGVNSNLPIFQFYATGVKKTICSVNIDRGLFTRHRDTPASSSSSLQLCAHITDCSNYFSINIKLKLTNCLPRKLKKCQIALFLGVIK